MTPREKLEKILMEDYPNLDPEIFNKLVGAFEACANDMKKNEERLLNKHRTIRQYNPRIHTYLRPVT